MWIYVPRGSCPSAPESGSSIPASAWRSRLLASSAALSTKHTPPTSWLRAWKMKPWMKLLFGRISEPSTAVSGVASWMESLAATPASPSVTPGSASERRTLGTYGQKSIDFSGKSPLGGASLRMSADTSTTDSQSYTKSFEHLVSELKLDYSARRKSARATKERDSSFWPTVRTRSTLGDTGSARRREEGENPGLNDMAKNWPTPNTAPESLQLGSNQKSSPPSLGAAATLWPTPRTITGGAESAERKQQLGRETSGGGDLQAAVENWPTPNQRDYKGCDLKTRHGGASLPHFVETGERVHSQSLPQVQVTSVSGGELSRTDLSTALRQRLNPAFVCWLMGWPWWWTNPGEISSARSAMESYLSRLRMLLASLLVERDSPR